jgi:predicted dehydrogenase
VVGETIRVGVIGGGIWGTFHLRAAKEFEREGKVELVAIADQAEEIADKQSQVFGIKKYTNYQEMITHEDLDAVSVATPDHLHQEMVLYGLNHGLHVLVEKPLDLTTSGCRNMVDLAQERDLLLQVDMHKRYDPYNIDVMHKVREGKIGEPYYVYAYMEDKIIVPTEWLAKWAASSSPFWFIGVHKYDFVRWITGKEAITVFAQGKKGKLLSMGIDTFDSVSAHIVMEGDMSCHIDVNWILPRQFEAVVNQGLRIVGSEGFVELDSQDRGLRYCFADDGAITPNYGALFSDQSVFGWENVSGYFVDAIKDFYKNVSYLKSGGSIREIEGKYPSGYDGLMITQVAEAVHLSIKEKRPVEISEIDG